MDEDGESDASQIRPDDADSSPLWQIFDVVNNYTDNLGTILIFTLIFAKFTNYY